MFARLFSALSTLFSYREFPETTRIVLHSLEKQLQHAELQLQQVSNPGFYSSEVERLTRLVDQLRKEKPEVSRITHTAPAG